MRKVAARRSEKGAWLRFSPMHSGCPGAHGFQRREKVGDFVLRCLRRIRAVNRVVVDRFSEIGADRARRRLFRIGGAHELAVHCDRAFALEHLNHHRARDHEIDQVAEERAFAVNCIKAFRFITGQPSHPRRDDLESRFLETSINRPDDVFGNRVRFDDGKGTFYRHSWTPTCKYDKCEEIQDYITRGAVTYRPSAAPARCKSTLLGAQKAGGPKAAFPAA